MEATLRKILEIVYEVEEKIASLFERSEFEVIPERVIQALRFGVPVAGTYYILF